MNGVTELWLSSLRGQNDSLFLDARGITVGAAYRIGSDSSRMTVNKLDDGIALLLNGTVALGDRIAIRLEYRTEVDPAGVRFTDPLGIDSLLPTQAWSGTDSDDIASWLPTIHAPTEMATMQLNFRTPMHLQTIAPGKRIESRADSTAGWRTDSWLISKPVSPSSLRFAAVAQSRNSRFFKETPVSAYIEPEFEPFRSLVYQPLANLHSYFTERLGPLELGEPLRFVPLHGFPLFDQIPSALQLWPNYAQFDNRAARDISNTELTARSMARVWLFGESPIGPEKERAWREGLISYLSALSGSAVDPSIYLGVQMQRAWDRYLKQSRTVRYAIYSEVAGADKYRRGAHTYGKAPLIFYQLHQLLGDEVWWAALRIFRDRAADQGPSLDRLQTALEQQWGKPLDRFFTQWFRKPGHPLVTARIDTNSNTLRLRLSQDQQRAEQPLFKLWVPIEIRTETGFEKQTLEMSTADSIYHFTLQEPFRDVIIDPEGSAGIELQRTFPRLVLLERLDHPEPLVRLQAIRALRDAEWSAMVERRVMETVKSDPVPAVREAAIALLSRHFHADLKPFLLQIDDRTEPEGRVRIQALKMLAADTSSTVQNWILEMTEDPSYFVAAEAISIYGRYVSEDSYSRLKHLADSSSYRGLYREALITAMRFADEPGADTLLESYAREPTDLPFPDRALTTLAYRFESELTAATSFVPLCINRLERGFGFGTGSCLTILSSYAEASDLERIENLLDSKRLTKSEKIAVEQLIAQLREDTLQEEPESQQ